MSPIRAENAHRYGEAWDALAIALKFCADYRCECDGRCGRPAEHLAEDGRCRNVHGAPAFGTGSRVVLTVAHLDHVPEHNERSNLMVACQGCHLHYDREHHAQTRASRLERAGQLSLAHAHLTGITGDLQYAPGLAITVRSERDDELYAMQLRDDFYRHVGMRAEKAAVTNWAYSLEQLRDRYVNGEIEIEEFEAELELTLKREAGE